MIELSKEVRDLMSGEIQKVLEEELAKSIDGLIKDMIQTLNKNITVTLSTDSESAGDIRARIELKNWDLIQLRKELKGGA